MAVNYDIWGAPEEWQNIDSSTWANLANCKKPKSGRTSYYNAFNAGALTAGDVPTDLSLAFWGIGKGSILAHPMYLSSYWEGDTIKTAANEVQKPDNVPCVLNYASDPSSTQANMQWSYRYAPTDNPGESNFNINNLLGNVALARTVIASFNYQKVYLVPYVKIAAAGSSSWARTTVSLKDYIDGMTTGGTYENYSKVISIGYREAVGDGIDNNRTTGLKEMGITFPVSFEGSQRSYQNGSIKYTWFATRYGINAFMTNLTLDYYTHSLAPYYEWGAENFNSLHLVGDADTGFRRKYCKNYYAGGNIYGQVPIYYYNPDNDIWKINDVTPWNTGYADPFPYIECTPENKETVRDYILSQIAYLGFPFMYDPTLAARGQIGETGVYLPVFDDKGVTTGEYAEGRAAIRLRNSDWTNGHESGYDPTAGGDDDGDTGNLNNFPTYQNRYANANAVYALDESNFINFVNDVNLMYTTDTDDTRMKLDFKGSNPNDYIIGVYGIPFLCNYIVPSGGDDPINLGPVPLPTAKGKKVDTSLSLMRDCGTVTIPAKGNFLDYEPYTQIELYIPMCGTIQLDCAQVVGRTLHVIVYYDVTTMACVGCVYRDAPEGETLIHTINGTIGASLPLTSARMGDYQNSVQTTKNALKQNEMRTALGVGGAVIGIAGAALAPETGGLSLALAGAAIGGLATAAAGAMTEKQLQYDLTHKQPALSQCSAADGMTAQLVSDLRPWIFIKRAKDLPSYDAATYGKTVGFACCINSTVGAFSGFTVYSNVDLSGIPATKTEIDMIRAKLNSGIYI